MSPTTPPSGARSLVPFPGPRSLFHPPRLLSLLLPPDLLLASQSGGDSLGVFVVSRSGRDSLGSSFLEPAGSEAPSEFSVFGDPTSFLACLAPNTPPPMAAVLPDFRSLLISGGQLAAGGLPAPGSSSCRPLPFQHFWWVEKIPRDSPLAALGAEQGCSLPQLKRRRRGG